MRRVRALLATVVVLLLAGSGAVALAQTLPPGLGIQLLQVPRGSADNPRANTYIIDHVIPGATVERDIAVSNGTNRPMVADLYGAAADVEDGWVVAGGRGGNELAEWMTITPSQVQLAPGERRTATVTIEVPADATGGERYAAAIAETSSVTEGNVRIVDRVGVRVYLSVGADATPETDFAIDTLTGGRDDAGQAYVLIGVSNIGGRAVDLVGDLTLDEGPGQLSAGPFPVAFPLTIGPGGTGELRVPMDGSVPAGPWHAVARLQSGLVERAAEGVISFPDGAGELADEVTVTPIERQRRALMPVAGILLLVAVMALVFVILARRLQADEDDHDGEGADLAVGAPG